MCVAVFNLVYTVFFCLEMAAGRSLAAARRALRTADTAGLVPCLCCHSNHSSSTAATARATHLDPLGGGALPLLSDAEGARIPEALERFRPIDAHTHLFPPRLQLALLRWFREHAWPCRHEELLTAACGGAAAAGREEVIGISRFLLDRGLTHLVVLLYAHRPGMAADLNAWLAAAVAGEGARITALATAFPGEAGNRDMLRTAFTEHGLKGVKLHTHVQATAADDRAYDEIYEVCADFDLPVIIHAGREPNSAGYPVSSYELCSAERLERVLRRFPGLRLCVPHMGADEFEAYADLMATSRFERSLWLDTTMVLGTMKDEYWAGMAQHEALVRQVCASFPHRVMYGTDWPMIPYAWDRELKQLQEWALPDDAMARILRLTAVDFYGIHDGGNAAHEGES